MINALKNKIISWYFRGYVKNRLLTEFYRRKEENTILQDYITKRILDGQEFRRKELIEKQGEEKEIALFINYLKRVK